MKILELPFRERPVLELLNLHEHRDEPQFDYAGYGWARVPAVWLAGADGAERIDDALVLALHSADDGEGIADDIELGFEVPGEGGMQSVNVLASTFLDRWLPQLPRASAVVLVMCNPHRARLRRPEAATAPVYYATGDVESWLDHEHDGDRIRLAADGSWARLDA